MRSLLILRNGRGRIRCYDSECRKWAVKWERRATQWSVSERVPVCLDHMDPIVTSHVPGWWFPVSPDSPHRPGTPLVTPVTGGASGQAGRVTTPPLPATRPTT